VNFTVLSRRRIERYAQLLDESYGGRHRHSKSPLDDELSGLIAIGDGLSDMGRAATSNIGGPSEQWKMETRARLIAEVERERMAKALVPAPATVRPGRAGIRVRGAILVGLAVGTLALSGMSAASSSAVPGDPLYGIKRSQESAQLTLATSDANKGKLYLEFAAARLAEAKAIHANPKLLASTLSDMDHETKLGISLLTRAAVNSHNEGPLAQVNDFVETQSQGVNNLLNLVRSNAGEYNEVLRAIPILGRAGLRTAELHDAFACKSIVVIRVDELGPQPAKSCQVSAPASSPLLTTTPVDTHGH
jgi:hypothetical protein